MNYSDIIGQNHILDHFRNAIDYGKVSHAYILNGEKGTGKKSMARLFAQALECESPDKPCGLCHACKQCESDNHPDIKWITHEKPNTISVADVREQLNGDIMIKPYSGAYKVYIIDEAEKLNVAAQNAILKTIEEPPAYAVILLLTNNAATFLPTIMSRCVMLNVRPLGKEVIADYLMRKQGIPDYNAKLAAEFADGNLGKAINLAASDHFNDLKDNVLSVVVHAKDMELSELVAAVKEVDNYKLEIEDYLNVMRMWYRDVLLYKATRNIDELIFKDKVSDIIKIAEKSSFNGIQEVLEAIDKCRVRLNANVNFDLAVELMFLTINERC